MLVAGGNGHKPGNGCRIVEPHPMQHQSLSPRALRAEAAFCRPPSWFSDDIVWQAVEVERGLIRALAPHSPRQPSRRGAHTARSNYHRNFVGHSQTQGPGATMGRKWFEADRTSFESAAGAGYPSMYNTNRPAAMVGVP